MLPAKARFGAIMGASMLVSGLLVPLFLYFTPGSAQNQATIDSIQTMVDKKDFAKLRAITQGSGKEWEVLRGGAYDVGSKGWKVLESEPSFGGKYVVISTPMTSQDIGELLFERVGNKLKYIDEQQSDGLRLRHHNLRVAFDINKKTTQISDVVDGSVTDEGSKIHCLRFSPCYKVASITDGKKAVPFLQTGGIVMIPRQPVGGAKFYITYSGVVNLPGYAGAITPNSASLTNDYWYPMVNRYPTTYEITVVPPDPEWKVIAQGKYLGKEKGVKEPGEMFQMDLPAIYWSLTVLKAKHYSEPIDGRTLQIWSPRMPEAQMKLQPALYAPIIKLFDKNFGKFPFDSYGALDSPTYGGGALEAYSYATYGGGLPAEDAHEPSHTWFGGILPNTYLKSFWNESFAVWSEGYFAREVPIGNPLERREAFAHLGTVSNSYLKAPLMESGAGIGADASALGYGKGAHVLAMLEQIIGTTNLLDAIQTWVRTHPKFQPAEWEDFEKIVLNLNRGRNLKSFFDDWFRRPGFASVALSKASFKDGKLSGTLAWSGPSFRMPLELWMENSGGGRSFVTLDTKDCDSSGNFLISVGTFKPSKVTMDPYHKALRTGQVGDQMSWESAIRRMKVYRDDSGYLPSMGRSAMTKLPDDLDGVLIIGHPDKTLRMKELCQKAGFEVKGNNLSYRGTTVDLNICGAVAVVPLGDGKKCAIALGKPSMMPNSGRASIAVVDGLGRFLRGECRFPDVEFLKL
jgi:hypothetical protein